MLQHLHFYLTLRPGCLSHRFLGSELVFHNGRFFGHCFGGHRKVGGHCFGGHRKVVGHCFGGHRKVGGHCFGGHRKVFGHCFGGHQVGGHCFGGGLHLVGVPWLDLLVLQ